MREIKYRAWYGNEMQEVEVYYFDTEQAVLSRSGIVHMPAELLMQYTGLKDTNGVEIYEGDIVALRYHRDRRYKVKAKVVQGKSIAAMVLSYCDDLTSEEVPLYTITANHNLMVVGNQYEGEKKHENKRF